MLALHMAALLLIVPAERKCTNPASAMPGYEWRQLVTLVDGVITPPDAGELDFRAEQIASIAIACWDPASDSFAGDGIPVIRVRTKALEERTRRPLLQLVQAQDVRRQCR